MTNTQQLIMAAASEIERLRRANQLLAAKVEVLDIFKAALSGNPGYAQPMEMDIAWALREESKRIEAEQKEQAQAPDSGPVE